MWQSELPHRQLLSEALYKDRQLVYEAIHKGDLGKVVLTVLNIIKVNNLLLPTNAREKSLNYSEQCRAEGNNAYKKGKHQKALEYYNKALLYAPKNSQALALAYSNRSALLYTMELYKACLKDIEMSLGLDCPSHVIEKLNQRKRKAVSHLSKELAMHLGDEIRKTRKVIDFTEFPKNRTVPCASLDLDFIVESGLPKVVASKQVRVGSVLAYEKAFFSSVENKLLYMACYYCQHVNPNLIPCDGCCNYLFCSEACMQKCRDEYHDIDCKILVRSDIIMPIVQAGIKLKKLFNSWTEFIEASNLLSLDRIQKSDIDQIFNGENKFSVLNFYSKRHFWLGRVYNVSLAFAEIIYGLLEIKSFFPKQTEEEFSAILAFSRVLMYMTLHIPFLEVMSSVTSSVKNKETQNLQCNSFGIFPVLGKLPHSCDPNALMVGLNNCMALVAIKPLAAGEAITVSYAGHRIDYIKVFRQDILLSRYGISCLCDLCMGLPWMTDRKPNEKQMRMYYKVLSKAGHISSASSDLHSLKQTFNSFLEALALLSDLPFSKEYKDVYVVFRKILLDVQSLYTQNFIPVTNE